MDICATHWTLSITAKDHMLHAIYEYLAEVMENLLKYEVYQFFSQLHQINP